MARLSGLTDREFVEARASLLHEPPRRQVIVDGSMRWEENARRKNESDAAYLLRLVCDVRNNLFHGGKYGGTDRNTELLRACLTILDVCLALDRNVKQAFEEGG